MVELIKLDNISLGFDDAEEGQYILKNISLSVENNELLVILGQSGVGKSTLLRLLSGLIPPSRGTISYAGGIKPRTGFVFQEPRLLPWRRTAENVCLGLENGRISKENRLRTAYEKLALVGLSGLETRWPSRLSGGQKQRVSIARALAPDPGLLLLDEPFGSLDIITRSTLQKELLEIRKKTGTPVVFVTHDIEEALILADRIVLIAGSPGSIAKEYSVDTPHPRKPDDPALLSLNAKIRKDIWKHSGSSRDSITSAML